VGGVLLAYQLRSLSSQSFMVIGALAALALTYLGGIATISGAVIAGIATAGGVLTQVNGGTTGTASNYQYAISGLLLIVVAIFAPDGLSVTARRMAHRVARAVSRTNAAPVVAAEAR
jgi:ABC-type branched-subunit amino acid transport system permease subunit